MASAATSAAPTVKPPSTNQQLQDPSKGASSVKVREGCEDKVIAQQMRALKMSSDIPLGDEFAKLTCNRMCLLVYSQRVGRVKPPLKQAFM